MPRLILDDAEGDRIARAIVRELRDPETPCIGPATAAFLGKTTKERALEVLEFLERSDVLKRVVVTGHVMWKLAP
jgi:hypothetical protein